MAVSEMTRSRYGTDFPVDDLTYDLVSVMYQKSKGLEAYKQYLEDARGDAECENLFRQMHESDTKHVKELEKHLSQRLKQGGPTH